MRKQTAVIDPSSIFTCITNSLCLISNTRTTPFSYPTPIMSTAGDCDKAVTGEGEEGFEAGKEWI